MLDPLTSGGPGRNAPVTAVDALGTALTRPRPGVVLLAVHGEIDTLTSPQLERALADVLADPGDHRLVVDLKGVTFLASSGLAVFIRAARRAEGRGLRLHLVADSRAVRRPLEITGIDQLFDIHTDSVDAVGEDTVGVDAVGVDAVGDTD